MFSKATGIRVFAGRYAPGALTNPSLKEFFEIKLLVVTDPWPDKNIVDDALKLGIPVIALCDTNNELTNVDLVIPCNNKGKKSLGLIFYILAKEYLKAKGKIDAIIVGADRVAANGDAANKIGTLGHAISANYYKVPMYFAVPNSTIDTKTPTGKD